MGVITEDEFNAKRSSYLVYKYKINKASILEEKDIKRICSMSFYYTAEKHV
ncbi:hypothetical protein LQK80_32945 [Bacillus thuringiensis]|nr:hypothetical protein [Bacillus thuringiensis]